MSAAAIKEKHGGDLAPNMSVRLWLRLLSCAMVIEKRLRRGLTDKFDATLPRFDVLAALDANPDGIGMSALSQRLLVSNGNVTGLVQALIRDGFVQSRSDPDDRRAQIVCLTPGGRARFAEMAAAHHGWIEGWLAGLSGAERDALYGLLGRVKASLADHDDFAGDVL